jgi:hypothetical protein
MSAEIPKGYYDSVKGLKGEALKKALTPLARPKTTPSYGSGYGKTWYYFWETDRMPDGTTWRNRYSDDVFTVGNRGDACSGMNIEHSFPRSWFGGSGTAPDTDLFNLYPSPANTNGSKSNYIMDEIATVNEDKSDGYTKIGTSSHTSESWAWEPNDTYKGDFSRGYMYMITAWKNDVTFTSRAMNFMDNSDYPALHTWAATLYSKWCRMDTPDQVEIDRNNAIYKIQGNRNPFIDFPNLFEYLWGDSTAYAFDPVTTVKAEGSYTEGSDGSTVDPGNGSYDLNDPDDFSNMPQLFYADFTSGDYGCTQDVTLAPGTNTDVWTRSDKYGWVANSYISTESTRYASDGTLITSAIDLTDCTHAYVQFEHSVNYLTEPTAYLSVYIESQHVYEDLNYYVTWPAGNSWTFYKSGVIDLSQFVGDPVNIEFRYTSTTDNCGSWEIKNIDVRGGNINSSGIESIFDTEKPMFDPTAPAEYYTIDGRRTDATAHGVIIVRQGTHTFKFIK